MSEQHLSAEEKALLAEAEGDDAKSARRKRKEPEVEVKPEASKNDKADDKADDKASKDDKAKDGHKSKDDAERGPFAPAQYDGDDGWNGLPVQMRG